MPVKSDDPLRRVTLNLYEADCVWLEQTYGRGWTERVRQHIHNEVLNRQHYKGALYATSRRTLGDLE
jgi:hypothetical protein